MDNKYSIEIVAASSELNKDELIKKAREKNIWLFDENSILCRDHIKFAFFHAKKAFEEKRNIAKSFDLEILLRAACTKQIKKAIEKVGIKDPKNILLVWEIGRGKKGGKVKEKKEKEEKGKGERSKNKILNFLKARERKWMKEENKRADIIKIYNLNRKKDLMKQIVEKMVEVQLEE